jgi:hypothetical protein
MGTKGLKKFSTRSCDLIPQGLAFLVILWVTACSAADRKAVESLEIEDVEAYWSVWGKKDDNNYINPVVRFKVRNGGESSVDYVQATAVFRRESNPNESWGNAFEYALAGDPISPGGLSREITLKCDSTFFSKDPPRKMLENEHWQQVNVEVFLRVGSSPWKTVTKMEIPRRLGAKGLEKFLEPQEPEASPEQAPQGKQGQ